MTSRNFKFSPPPKKKNKLNESPPMNKKNLPIVYGKEFCLFTIS